MGPPTGADGKSAGPREEGVSAEEPCGPVEAFETSCGIVVVFPAAAQGYRVEPLVGEAKEWQITELGDHVIEVIAPDDVDVEQDCLVRAVYRCGDRQRSEVIKTRFPVHARADESCGIVKVHQTACGVLVLFPPDASGGQVNFGSDERALRAEGLNTTSPTPNVVEVTPGSITQETVEATVTYTCGEAEFSGPVTLDFNGALGRKPQRVQFTGSGATGGSPTAGSAAASTLAPFQNLISRPISVAFGGAGAVRSAGGGAGPAPGGLAAWTHQQTSSLFPALPQNFTPAQFAQQLQQLGQQAARPSPFGGGGVATVALPAIAGAVGAPPAASGSPVPAWGGAGAPAPAYAMGMAGGSASSGGSFGYGSPGSRSGMANRQFGGPFATALSIAGALEETALPALRDLRPITPDADLDEVEAQRQIVMDALTTLIGEARRNSADGPDPIVVTNADARLQLALLDLRQALGLATGTLVSAEDFANQSRFDLLQQWVDIAHTALTAAAPSPTDPRPVIARVKELLRIVADSSRDLATQLDNIGVTANERARMLVTSAVTGQIRLGRLLDWIADEAGRQMPSLLDTAGKPAGASIRQTLTDQRGFITPLTTLSTDPWAHPLVRQAVSELDRQLGDALTEAGGL